MNVLFLGDITARIGRELVKNQLSSIKQKYEIDLTIVNGENSAHGKGITKRIYEELLTEGVDIITLGNHAFSKNMILEHLDSMDRLVRPMNLEPLQGGNRYIIREVNGLRIAVVNLIGTIFMDCAAYSPFEAMDALLHELEGKCDCIIVDFHGEATSEKELFFAEYRDRVTAVLGTHTHVQTADEIIRNGCAYITDVGMCGPFDSILGRDTAEVRKNLIMHEHTRYTPSEMPGILCGCVVRINEQGRAESIERIQIRPE